jgi:hypothetical protein
VIEFDRQPGKRPVTSLYRVVGPTFAWLHQGRRLRIRWERRPELLQAFMHLACAFLPAPPQSFVKRALRPRAACEAARGNVVDGLIVLASAVLTKV